MAGVDNPGPLTKAFRLGCGCCVIVLCTWIALVGIVTTLFVGGLAWNHYGPQAEYWREAE
jgi:hypothetical protein